MAYRFDSYDNSLVIDGWAKGVADSPFDGIADMRNCNIVSIPGEASVNFATAKISSPVVTTVTVTGLSSNVLSFSAATGLEDGMAIQFTSVGSLSGVSTGTTYWVWACSPSTNPTSCKISANGWVDIGAPSTKTITGTPGGATFTIYAPQQPKYFVFTGTYSGNATGTGYFMLDSIGQLWSNNRVTGVNSYWTYLGLTGTSDTTHGNGLAYIQPTSNTTGNGFVFVWNDNSIDYVNTLTGAWSWGWKPSTGINHQSNYLKFSTNYHEALLAPDNRIYYCDGTYIGSFYETNPITPFDPTNTSSYTQANFQLLPGNDVAQCLTFLGTNLMIGGMNNVVYPWDRSSNHFNYPLLLAESNIKKMVTVNTNTFIFVGNRGRIYITNGTNAQLFKKVPDHISGTVEPYFTWGGACSVKNQLYFGVLVQTNAGSAINQYGGVWAIDLDTQAIRLTNKLSYGSYAGYATAIIPNFGTNPAGTGLFIGWDDNSSHWGIDQTTSAPYTSSQATIDSDLIPIGTFQNPRNFTKLEYRLTVPLVAGESVTIKTRLIFNGSYSSGALIDSTTGDYSGISDVDFEQAQWVQFQIVLNSTASSPSYTRLKEIRVLGLVGPTLATSQQLGL